MMKKVLALILSLCMALTLVACGGSSSEPAPEASDTPEASEPGELEPIVIKFGTGMTSTEFCTQILVKWIEEVEKVSEGWAESPASAVYC